LTREKIILLYNRRLKLMDFGQDIEQQYGLRKENAKTSCT